MPLARPGMQEQQVVFENGHPGLAVRDAGGHGYGRIGCGGIDGRGGEGEVSQRRRSEVVLCTKTGQIPKTGQRCKRHKQNRPEQ